MTYRNVSTMTRGCAAVCVAIIATTLAACGGGGDSGGTSGSGTSMVAVPNAIGNSQAAATTAITGAGLTLGTVTMQSSSTVASGGVISESPAAGTSVASGSAVNLVVSSGPAQVAVPNVVGDTQAAATTAITGAGLTLGTVTMQSSSTVASGSVISESPAAASSVASGSAVSLVVSSGPAPGASGCSGSPAPGTASSGTSEVLLHCFGPVNVVDEPVSPSSDGLFPVAGLIFDQNGNLYGTTESGGVNGYGAVFKLTPTGNGSYSETLLYSFAGVPDGILPNTTLVVDGAGNLYGTTQQGGANDNSAGVGGNGNNVGGTVFKLAPNGDGTYAESVLWSFAATATDGQAPNGVILDGEGNLYGTTQDGGVNGTGAVFKLSPSGNDTYTEALLYSFGPSTGSDGQVPFGGVILDGAGNLYGTTSVGGANGGGAVFELAPVGNGSYAESVLHSFGSQASTTDGHAPEASLTLGSNGNLYGTTRGGGANSNGIVFELSPAGNGTYTESVLYAFGPGTDAQIPGFGPLILDSGGNLYGTTEFGGVNGTGTVFKLTAGGTETILYSFGPESQANYGAGSDGLRPQGGLTFDNSGNLYGTTSWGGTSGGGVVFEIK